MFAQDSRRITSFVLPVFQRTVQNVRQKESRGLKLPMNRLCGLTREENFYSAKKALPFSAEALTRRVQKLRVLARSDASQQQRPDVHGPVARRPLQSAQPSRNMFGRAQLSTPVAAKDLVTLHVVGIVEEMQANCKLSLRWRAYI
jgi:hypothetical protein